MKTFLLSLATLAVLVGQLACTSDGGSCDHPATVTYSAAPVGPGEPGCAATSLFGYEVPSTDVGKTYPPTSKVTLPVCSGNYPDESQDCYCYPDRSVDGGADAGTSYAWECPL